MTRLVIHLWTNIIDPQSRLGLERIETATEYCEETCLIEHHCLGDEKTMLAHELVYAAKDHHCDPQAAAQAGVEMVKAIASSIDNGLDIGSREELADLGQIHGLDRSEVLEGLASHRWNNPAATDIADARRVHATTPPFAIIGGIMMVAGLKTTDEYVEILTEVAGALNLQRSAAEAEARYLTSGRDDLSL